MAIKGVAYTAEYAAFNHRTRSWITGDVANHTLEISKDGGAFVALTNAPVEVSNGWYKIVLTDDEMDAKLIVIRAVSSTADVLLSQIHIETEQGAVAGDAMALTTAAQNAMREAIFDKTGITAGGSLSFKTLMKLIAGMAVGGYNMSSAGGVTTMEILDVEDNSVLATVTINETTGSRTKAIS